MGQISRILESEGFTLKKKTAKEYSSPCPFCGGTDRFIIWPADNAAWCRQCKWVGDDIQLLVDKNGWSFRQAAEAVGRGDNGTGHQHKPTHAKGKKPFKHPELGYPTERYVYTDEKGSPIFHVCRFSLPNGDKSFRQCNTDGLSWSLRDVKPVLLNLPSISKAKWVCFAEGEKDSNALAGLGWDSTTNPGGAGKLPGQVEKANILAPLEGKKVVIFPDNDDAGRKHAAQAAELLYGKAESIRIVCFNDQPEKSDVSDFIQKHGRKAKTLLIERMAAAKPWEPEKHFFGAEDLLSREFEKQTPIIDSGVLPYNGHILIAGGNRHGEVSASPGNGHTHRYGLGLVGIQGTQRKAGGNISMGKPGQDRTV